MEVLWYPLTATYTLSEGEKKGLPDITKYCLFIFANIGRAC